MARPTIKDVADAAGVSVSTVNRALAGSEAVRGATLQRIRDAAEKVGFYGLGAITSHTMARRQKHRFGFLLNQPTRAWYKLLAAELKAAAQRLAAGGHDIDVRITFADDLAPQHIARLVTELGAASDVVGVVAAVHPIIMQAVANVEAAGVPVFALVSPLSATPERYVGEDNWKVGRTAAWAFAHMCKAPGKLGIFVGNHRYRCQEMNESGFRAYFRENAPEFTLLEPRSTFEQSSVSQELTEQLLQEHPDLAGLYVAGGGISGVVTGVRNAGKSGQLVVVGYELMDITRAALLDHTLTMVISNPLPRFADETMAMMLRAAANPGDGSFARTLPFEIYTSENI